MTDHMKTICEYLEDWGGSRNINDYRVVNYGKRARKMNLEIRKRGDNMCLCGKEDIVNIYYIQLKTDATAPLLQVGSVCVDKFMENKNKSRTRHICAICREPLRSRIEEVHKKCAIKEQIEERIKEAEEKRKNDKADAFNRKRIMKMVMNVWKRQTSFYPKYERQERIKTGFLEATNGVWTFDKYDQHTINFGKYNGKQLKEVPSEYLIWLMRNNVNLYYRRKEDGFLLFNVPSSCYLDEYVLARNELKFDEKNNKQSTNSSYSHVSK